MKIALVHDWLLNEGGAENVLRHIAKLYPSSSLFTLMGEEKNSSSYHTSFLQKFPLKKQLYRHFFPLYPKAISQFDLSAYEVIISSAHAASKGVRTRPDQLHICYCHTPMRFIWDLHTEYQKNLQPFSKLLSNWMMPYMRKWDRRSASSVNHFVANSLYVQERIKRIYQRESAVIYPPVDVDFFQQGLKKREDFFVTTARLVSYKKIDLIVEAFNEMPHKKLYVIGDGPEGKKLKQLAKSNTIFLGYLPRQTVRSYLQRARGFIFAAEEDFGIAPVEAQASGTPILAFGKGGALETVKKGLSGLFFKDQDVNELKKALKHFEATEWDHKSIQNWSNHFSLARFEQEFYAFVQTKWEQFCESDRFSRR